MITYSVIQKFQLEGAKRMDAEYYQPEYLELNKKLKNLGAVFLKNIAIETKLKFKPKKQEFFQYIEISKVNTNTGEYEKIKIAGEEAPDRAQCIVQKDNLIVSMVRPNRNAVSFVKEDIKNLVCSSGFAVLKSYKIEPEYLFAYLKSKPMIKQLERQITATMYPAVTAEDILNAKIYLGNKKFNNEVKNKVIEAQNELKNAKSLYQQAENLLLRELKISEKDLDNQLSCIVNLSDAKDANRFDAEYFEPKYKKLISLIRANGGTNLGDLVSVKKGIEPGAESYREEGKQFIRVSSLSKYEISDSEQKYLSEELYNKLKIDYQPQKGEILLTKDASPGIVYILKENIEGIISSGILRLKLKNKEIEDEYLALCLNSIIGKMQAERDAGGSVIMHWKPEEIKNVIIPILPKPVQEKISSFVRQSFESRKRAKQLLEEAKIKVESLIEKQK